MLRSFANAVIPLAFTGAVVSLSLVGCGGGGGGGQPSTSTTTTWPLPPHEVTACAGLSDGTPPNSQSSETPTIEEYDKALLDLDLDAVKADLNQLFTKSQDCWPADVFGDAQGNYGPFFVRLAWHCSGSYRATDNVGGCAGGRQRFEPEASWDDNTNLDKARALLSPIKTKYGAGLSWGDLFNLAGTTALRQMGTPVKQFCVGRIDDADGTQSMVLGPTPQQEANFPCPTQGHCEKPLGSTTLGLIYLNPEGPVELNKTTGEWESNPDPNKSAKDVRDSFARMNHSDESTVALIGGGHAFGKTHGACPKGAGPSPKEVFSNPDKTQVPWPGMCGTGVGSDAYTSGFEGPWTTKPLIWDNEYFDLLLNRKWEKHRGPGGKWQWKIVEPQSVGEGKIIRLTSDMALLEDPAYLEIVKKFADPTTGMQAFNDAFDEGWNRLVTKAPATQWSKNRRCDAGDFPEQYLQWQGIMLGNDITV